MNATVTAFDLGFTSSALRMPYALAVLSCGHKQSVVMRPNLYACGACGRETTNTQHASCQCGSKTTGFRHVRLMNPHTPEDRVTRVGDVVECTTCDQEAQQLEWLRALPSADVQHAWYKVWCGVGQYHFYRRDTSSPTGVFLIGSVTATKAVDALLAEKRISPLSPTEPR